MRGKVTLIPLLVLGIATIVYNPTLKAKKNQYARDRAESPSDVNRVLMMEGEEAIEEPPLHLVINIPARKATLYDEGVEVFYFDVAVGSPLYRTPIGSHTVDTIIWNPWWIPPDSPWAKDEVKTPPGPKNPLGPVKLLLQQGIRIHGTNANSSVGRYASHGCVRMHNDEARLLAQYIQKRLNAPDDSLFETYEKNRYRSFYVNLQQSISVDFVYEPVELRGPQIFIYADTYHRGQDVKTEVLNTLIRNGINLKKVEAARLETLRYPKGRYDVVTLNLEDLFSGTSPQNISLVEKKIIDHQ